MDVVIYTTPICPDCQALKHWLEASGIPYEERDLTDVTIVEEDRARTGVARHTRYLLRR